MTHCVIPAIPLTERRAYTMGECAALLGMSISTLYAERARGRLETIKAAGRRLITREQLDAYLAAAGRQRPPETPTTPPLSCGPSRRARPAAGHIKQEDGLS